MAWEVNVEPCSEASTETANCTSLAVPDAVHSPRLHTKVIDPSAFSVAREVGGATPPPPTGVHSAGTAPGRTRAPGAGVMVCSITTSESAPGNPPSGLEADTDHRKFTVS